MIDVVFAGLRTSQGIEIIK